MRLIPFLNSHARFSADADAFVDGELRGEVLARFRDHLAGCDRCAVVVAGAESLKASLRGVAEQPAPRSFALTPAMLTSERKPAPPAAVGTPLYLGFARVAAAVSVVAFVAVFTLSLIGGGSKSNDQTTATASLIERNGAPVAADAAGGSAPGAATAPSTSSYAVGTPTALLPPVTTGAVSGAGAASATPAPPSTGAEQTPFSSQPNLGTVDTKSAGPEALGDAVTVEPASGAAKKDSSSDVPWTIVVGCIAGAFVGILVVAESRRRQS